MQDEDQRLDQLRQEIQELRGRVAELEKSEARLQRLTDAWRDLWQEAGQGRANSSLRVPKWPRLGGIRPSASG